MKTKLLRKVRKEYSIVDYPTQNKIAWYYKRPFEKSQMIWYMVYSSSNGNHETMSRDNIIKYAIESILDDIRRRHKKLGAYNRGKKIWY